ncbi:MAG: ATP-binding protein [Anaerolineae bacterium]
MNLSALIARGRGPMVEFLPDPDADRLAEQIVSFANAIGGTIVVGMDAQGRVYPDAAEYLEPAMARALRRCVPALAAGDLPEWQAEDTPKGQVVTITVKPTAYQVSLDGIESFVRSGANNVRLSTEQVERSARDKTPLAIEDDSVAGATLADLDDDILDEYQRNRIRRSPRGESFTRNELLRDAGAIDASGHLTVAGLLLFGRHPQRFIPQAGVVIVRFRGTSVRDAVASGERYSRRVEVVGPLARLVERSWEVLYEEISRQSTTEGLQRRESHEYPPEAVREAFVNAICHRDYAITGQRVEVRLFDDRMEIMSPGGLPGHITIDNILEEHYSRNPRLVRGLYQWGYIEELGQGIDIIYEAMQRDHHPSPGLRDTGRSFTVTLHNAVDPVVRQFGGLLSERQMRALSYLQIHDRISNGQYQALCPEVTPESLRLDLRDLVEKGILLKVGDKRGTFYVRK